MHRYLDLAVILGLVLLLLGLPALGQAQSGAMPAAAASQQAVLPPAPEGFWITANHDAVIQIAPCGNGLCGQIVGMFLGPREPTPKAWYGGSQCRLTIIRAVPRLDDSGQPYWTGSIVNPRDGATYNAIIRLDARNDLKLRGYIGLPIFGETQTWTPYQGPVAQNCRLSQPVG